MITVNYYGRNYSPCDANGVPFQNDLEHEVEMADRLLAMCDWKEKLEILNKDDREVSIESEKSRKLAIMASKERQTPKSVFLLSLLIELKRK